MPSRSRDLNPSRKAQQNKILNFGLHQVIRSYSPSCRIFNVTVRTLMESKSVAPGVMMACLGLADGFVLSSQLLTASSGLVLDRIEWFSC